MTWYLKVWNYITLKCFLDCNNVSLDMSHFNICTFNENTSSRVCYVDVNQQQHDTLPRVFEFSNFFCLCPSLFLIRHQFSYCQPYQITMFASSEGSAIKEG